MTRQWPASRIAGTGSYVPARVVTNDDLAKLVDTSDEWIQQRVGIRERRYAATGEASSDMAFHASIRAVEAAGIAASDLDMIIVGTITPDMQIPACAAFLQKKLGCKDIPSFDVAAACAGFVYAMSIADQFIRSGSMRTVLVVGVETLTSITNFTDRNTCVLFGDGAGAVVMTRADDDSKGLVLSTRIYTDSTLTDSLCIPAGGSLEPITVQAIEQHRNKVFMDGKDIFKVAVKKLTSASLSAMKDAALEPEQIDWVVPHQANLRIINQVAARLGVPYERVIINIENRGNTSSASIPLALDEAVRDGRIRPGHVVLMSALGAGISWASALVRM
ncbi:MAG TPA: beta-ketoacyl-ACP synthase III [Polyangiaceae bacterium]